MKTRISNRIDTQITPAEFQQAMEHYAAAGLRGLEINKAIEAEVNEILEKYEHELQCATHTKNTAYETLKNYCTANKNSLFSKRRSIGTPSGIAGFRLGTPRLKTKKGTNWGSILAQLKEKLPGYIRTVEEPAKDKLLADRHDEEVVLALKEMGVEVVQDELFYVETKQAA
jgi:phage host-nuclease inhibitor protein Gam